MVATPEVISQIDDYLWAIHAETQFLPALAQDWDAESSENRAIWQYEWAELMVNLDLLSEAYRAAQMTSVQRARYLALIKDVHAALPMLHWLALSPPRFALADLTDLPTSPSQEP